MNGPSVVTFGFDVRDRVEQAVAMVNERMRRSVAALEAVGSVDPLTSDVPMFLDGPAGKPREAVHLVFAGELVKPHDPVAAPDLSVVDEREGYRIAGLDRLIVMKLTAFRDKDRTHLRDMMEVGLIDATTLDRLPEPLRPRLQELLDSPGG